VPDETIVADYAESQVRLSSRKDKSARESDDGEAIERRTGFAAAADVMRATLAHVDAVYGGARAYLEQAGLSPAEIQQLKDRLRS
jgi:hypothetical protein